MRAILPLALVAVLASSGDSEIRLAVYPPDRQTALLPDPNTGCYTVMAGTRLPIVISSDVGEIIWTGGLGISSSDWEFGKLSGRGRNEDPNLVTLQYPGSALEAAGFRPVVGFFCDDIASSSVFQFQTNRHCAPGDWFVVDYRAEKPGHCEVDLFEFEISFDAPTQTLCFEHLPSRNFNGDNAVDFVDFALLARHFESAGEASPAFDINSDGFVDGLDIGLFSDYWLAVPDANEPLVEPPPPPCFPSGG
jgi:hypothetical protein